MSELRSQVLITLVHGTWPRGLFPKIALFMRWVRRLMRRKRPGPLAFWFEEGSQFRVRLSTELGDIPHETKPLLWSGANSIFVRDKTARVLAEHLSAEHAEDPQATQLVIAHSHGGNVALRALHFLHQPDGSWLHDEDRANPVIVTLATPFIEVEHADFGTRPALIRCALLAALWSPAWIFAKARFAPTDEFFLVTGAVILLLGGIIWWVWFNKRANRRRQKRVEALRIATQLGEMATAQAQRLLIIRAIDDEASLGLAFGTIVNYVMTTVIRYTYWIIFGPFSTLLLTITLVRYFNVKIEQEGWYQDAINVACSAFILAMFGLMSVARAAHGRELGVSPMELQINTQSAPDATGLSRIITLVRRSYVKSLRHGIYDHEDCAKTISDWVRSQVRAQPER